MNTNSPRHVNEAKLHAVANLGCNVVEHIRVSMGPLALAGLAGQCIKHPHLVAVVGHKLYREIELPHQLEEAAVCARQVIAQ